MNPYILPLKVAFEANADAEKAARMSKYMRDLFEYYGIPTPQRKEIGKQFFSEHGYPTGAELEAILRELWVLPQREFQYFAQGLLQKSHKNIGPEHIGLIEWMIVTRSWWDTVDMLAARTVGEMFQKFPAVRDMTMPKLRAAENFWLRRTAILYQLHYKASTDADLLFEILRENLGSTEFFINKAIGWALREYSKTDGPAVIAFVENTPLEPLSRREALKWMIRKGILK